MIVDALEAGDDGDLAAIDRADEFGVVAAGYAGLAVGLVGFQLELPAKP